METTLKDVLLTVFRIDNIVNKFHNKVQFMNLGHLMQRADSWDEDQLKSVLEAITPVYEKMQEVQKIVEDLQDPVLSLIASYDKKD